MAMLFSFKAFTIMAFLLPQVLCAGKKTTSLIFVEYKKDLHGNQLQNLMRYDFREGVIVEKELVLSTKTTDLRYDFYENMLYKNRYLITGRGDIIDMKKRNILYQPKDIDVEFFGMEENRVILQKTNGEQPPVEFYYYDFKTGATGKLLQPGKWKLPGLRSPDETHSITSLFSEIQMHDLKGTSTSLGTVFDSPQSSLSSFFSAPPMLWLDNKHILTQTNHGNIVILKTDGSIEPLMQIPVGSVEQKRESGRPCVSSEDNGESSLSNFGGCGGQILIVGNPRLFRDIEGRIYYDFKNENYLIDIQNKNYSLRNRIPAEHGFDLLFADTPCVVRYQGKEIGRCPVQYDPPTTHSGYFASTKVDYQGSQPHVIGINVWNKFTMKWQFIPVDWLTGLVGWIED